MLWIHKKTVGVIRKMFMFKKICSCLKYNRQNCCSEVHTEKFAFAVCKHTHKHKGTLLALKWVLRE